MGFLRLGRSVARATLSVLACAPLACGVREAPVATPASEPAPNEPAPAEPEEGKATFDVTDARWERVTDGPATLRGCGVADTFDGTYVCYATPGATCGSSETKVAELGAMLCTGVRTQDWSGTGDVPEGASLCCGAVKGGGGAMTVTYERLRASSPTLKPTPMP